jgi:hypothetical protein
MPLAERKAGAQKRKTRPGSRVFSCRVFREAAEYIAGPPLSVPSRYLMRPGV